MYIVRKGETARVNLPDKESAIDLIYALTVMGCSDSFHTQHIIGHKENEDVFEVCFLGKAIKVLGQRDAEMVLSWMLTLGCRKVSIEKLEEGKNDNITEEEPA